MPPVLRQICIALLIVLVNLGLTGVESDGTGLAAKYYANETLSGAPVLSRIDAQVDFVWAGGSAVTGLPVDSFSVRWDGEIEALYSEPLTLITRTDDGVRLWIDGRLVIDAWMLRSAADSTYTFTAEAGRKYRMRMEYYEHFGSAVAQLEWQSGTLVRAVIPTSQLYPVTPAEAPVGNGTGLLARYYANETLSDAPAMSRTDATVDFDWGGMSPAAAVPIDGFSARWDGEIEARYSEPLTITARTDDGVRVWVDGVLVVDAWLLRSPANSSFTFSAQAGQRYRIRLEYFEHTGAAVARLWWQSASEFQGPIPSSQLYPTPADDPPVGTGIGLLARFYTNETLSGAPVLTRTDTRVDFDWAAGSPGSGVPVDVFSARWDGEIEPRTTETLTLILRTDDGVRLWLNDQLVINAWVLRGATDSTYTFNAQAGQRYCVRIDYFEHHGSAVAKFWWQSSSEPKGPVPTSQLHPTAPVEPPLGTGTGLSGSYFTNETLTGPPAMIRLDAVVDSDWAGSSPASSIPEDSFSVRWEGEFEPRYTEDLTIIARTDDGVRVWIDDQPVITSWILRGATDSTYTFSAQAGQRYRIRMEYYEHFGAAVARLWWQSAHELRGPIPTTQLYSTEAVATPLLRFASAASAVSEKSGSTTIAVMLVPASTTTVTAALSVIGSGIQIPIALMIPAGQTTASIPVTIQDDPRYGPDRQVTIALSSPTGAELGQTTHVLTLQNTESKPIIGFMTDNSFNLEQSGTASVVVRLSAVSAVPTTVSVVSLGSATAGSDYTAPAATLQIPADTVEGTIFIPLLADSESEADETIVLMLANPVDAMLGGITAHTLTLSDGNLPPVIVGGPTPATDPVTGTSVELTLTASDDGAPAALITTWSVVGAPPAAVTFVPSSSTGFSAATIATFNAPGTYIIRAQVRDAYNATDTKQAIVTVVASRQPQIITFAALPAKVYGDAALTLTATASSGLPVTLTSGDPSVATISGNSVTIVGAGSTTITAAQAGDTMWEPAEPVSHPLTVAKASQIITFAALTACSVGDPPFALTASASSGQPVSYLSSDTSVATVSGSTVMLLAAGTTTITATQAGTANHLAATPVGQVLTVTKQSQAISFEALPQKTYGDAPFSLGATASSGLPVAYNSSDTNVATVSDNTVTIVGAGTTTITAEQGGNGNYLAAASVSRQLTISENVKQPQIITFAALPARSYGDAPFILTASSSSGLPVSYISSEPSVATISGNTVTIVGAGTTEIAAVQPGDATWEAAAPVIRSLTVSMAAPTVEFAVATSSVRENAGFASIHVTLSRLDSVETRVGYDVIGGTGTPGSDFTAVSGQLVFPAGSLDQVIKLPVTNDLISDPTETVVLELNSPVGLALGAKSTHTVTIKDTQSTRIRVDPLSATISENNQTGTALRFSRTGEPESDLTIAVTWHGDAVAGTHFAGTTPNSLLMPRGQSFVDVVILPIDNQTIGSDTNLNPYIASVPNGIAIEQRSTYLYILDDEVPRLSARVEPQPLFEGSYAYLYIGLVDEQGEQVVRQQIWNIAYQVSGPGIDESDFDSPLSGTVSTYPGYAYEQYVYLWVRDDRVEEGQENLTITVTASTSSTQISATIQDLVTVAIDRTAASVGETASEPASFRFIRAGHLASELVIPLTWENIYSGYGSLAVPGQDFIGSLPDEVHFAPGQAEVLIPVQPINDVEIESDEMVRFYASDGPGYSLQSDYASTGIAILDDEQPIIAVTLGKSEVYEDGTLHAYIGLHNANGDPISRQEPQSIVWSISGTNASDWSSATSGTIVTYPNSAYDIAIRLYPISDGIEEGQESFMLTASLGSLTGQATGRILDRAIVTIAVSAEVVPEQSNTSVSYIITRTSAITQETTVHLSWYQTATIGQDFSGLLPDSVTIAPGETTATVTITPIDDLVVESDEEIDLYVYGDAAYTISGPMFTSCAIVDNEPAGLKISLDHAINAEGYSSRLSAGLVDDAGMTINRLATNTVAYSISGVAAADLNVPLTGTITIPSQASSAQLYIPLINDGVAEGIERANITGVLGASTAGVTLDIIELNGLRFQSAVVDVMEPGHGQPSVSVSGMLATGWTIPAGWEVYHNVTSANLGTATWYSLNGNYDLTLVSNYSGTWTGGIDNVFALPVALVNADEIYEGGPEGIPETASIKLTSIALRNGFRTSPVFYLNTNNVLGISITDKVHATVEVQRPVEQEVVVGSALPVSFVVNADQPLQEVRVNGAVIASGTVIPGPMTAMVTLPNLGSSSVRIWVVSAQGAVVQAVVAVVVLPATIPVIFVNPVLDGDDTGWLTGAPVARVFVETGGENNLVTTATVEPEGQPEAAQAAGAAWDGQFINVDFAQRPLGRYVLRITVITADGSRSGSAQATIIYDPSGWIPDPDDNPILIQRPQNGSTISAFGGQ